MSELQLDHRIKKAGGLATEAFTYLNKLQKQEKHLLKTGHEFLDCHIQGLLPSDAILLAANSGVGKTKLLFDTLDQILDEKVNPQAKGIKTLEYAMEMRFLNRVLRDTNKLTNKKKSEILSEEFTEEEKKLVKQYYEALQDDRRYICEEPITTREFYEMTKTFCELYKDAEALVICIDHVLLLKKEDKFEDTAEALTSHINSLRKEFGNVYFILLSQMNRGSLINIKEKDNSMIPTTAMIYGSSHFEFLCSYIVTMVDPFRLGINNYLKVNRDRYSWLEDFFGEEDKNGKVCFNTIGNMFLFVQKTRESDTPYKNLFIRKMDLTIDQLDKMKQSVSESSSSLFSSPTPTFTNIPNFDTTIPPIQYENLSEAFGNTTVEKDDSPF